MLANQKETKDIKKAKKPPVITQEQREFLKDLRMEQAERLV